MTGAVKTAAVRTRGNLIDLLGRLKLRLNDNGHPTCPNCGANAYRRICKLLVYRWEGNVGYQIGLCLRCLSNPNKLDRVKIERRLVKAGTPVAEARAAGEFIEGYRKAHPN